MQSGIISMRYAKALLRFSVENAEEDKVYAETQTLAQTFIKVPALQQAMLSPVLSNDKKSKLLVTAACGTQSPSKSLAKFVELILKKQRAETMLFIAHSYGTLYRKMKHIIRGKLVVPAEVSQALVDRLLQVVEQKSGSSVDFHVEVDPAIGGGFILEYDTYSLDASVRTQLAKLKRELVS